MNLLDSIRSSNDVKKLKSDQLGPLCAELRETIIQNVAKTGGHLSSNLGTVELTVALHRVYDTSIDRVIFDVGHQSYAHKLLTGRFEQFHTLRQFGGISGFPKPYEAADDAFIAGHASNSVSVALGMARARSLKKEKYEVAAVIGDGALTGGLAFEGLTNAAASGEPMVIILNDNNMSIGDNVGGTANLLQTMRSRPGYIRFKYWYRAIFSRLPALYRFNHRVKEWFKSRLIPSNIFSEMGLYYLGPVDGHNVSLLETAIRYAKDAGVPVLLHVLTKKGKGCAYTEEQPDIYHGVSGYDPATGELTPGGVCFSEIFGEELARLAEEDDRIVAITAAMASGTGLERFSERFPDRFFDVGIAEGHAVSMAAGMAKQGLIPVFAVYSCFLQRSYDMMMHDVGLQKLHTVLAVDRAGLVGSDGETHHGVYDIAYLSTVPGMQIWCPSSFEEMRDMLRHVIRNETGPCAVRYPRGGEGSYRSSSLDEETVLLEGDRLTMVCYGSMVNPMFEAAYRLKERGIGVDLIKLNRVRPNRMLRCLDSLKKTGRLLIAEDVCAAGCVGEELLADAEKAGLIIESTALNLGDGVVTHGTVPQLLRLYQMDAEGLFAHALELLNREKK